MRCYCNVFILIFSMELFKATIRDLYKSGDWKTIIKVLGDEERWFSNVLWIRPTEDNLKFISNNVIESGLEGLVSIGCGSGLLEWLIQSATGLKVIGLEVERNYWASHSQHNGPSFVHHIYPDNPEFNNYYSSKDYALLFCYFNYRKPFNDYISKYKGNCVIIIGPGPGRGTHSDPEPFEPRFSCGNWTLVCFQEIRETKDFVAIYKRERSSTLIDYSSHYQTVLL